MRAPDWIVIVANKRDPVQHRLQVGTQERSVGHIHHLDHAICVDHKQARFGKRAVGFFWTARVRNIEAKGLHLSNAQIIPHGQAQLFFVDHGLCF